MCNAVSHLFAIHMTYLCYNVYFYTYMLFLTYPAILFYFLSFFKLNLLNQIVLILTITSSGRVYHMLKPRGKMVPLLKRNGQKKLKNFGIGKNLSERPQNTAVF